MSGPFVLEINVPERLKTLAAKETALFGPLNTALSGFSTWLADNKTPFFFDYTDHGIAHVTNVLNSSESIISKRSWPHLSPQDACAIIASVLLHDCAMHLSEEGFFQLLAQEKDVKSNFVRMERSWNEEYFSFEQEAARWDSAKLMSVFGDTDAPERLFQSKSLSQRQRLLVGEFLRRHHARLAHEIAISGVPGVGGEKFTPFGGFTPQVRDLYGFLARSHNLNIRQAADAIPPMQRRMYLGVHVPFIMAVLRVADYIQIDSARAPTQILQLRGLKSPVSRQEWAKHHAVIQLDRFSEDPEALTVITDPPNVQIFVGLRLLFADLQRELDESWAALGEVYGRFEELSELGLNVRRIRTNLDDVQEFELQNRPSYVPQEVRLTTASAELLHLLVGPLYGNRPTVGVREMLQNAVDAVLERSNYLSRHNASESYVPSVSIDVDLSKEGRCINIRDNGIGMELETLELFFLKAGASFRRSKWWKGNFADENGGALVRRSGRFGVGALASFLIGPVVEIRTRHFLDETGRGLRLRFTLDNDLIELERVELPYGTSITIPIESDQVANAFVANGSYDEPPFFGWYLYEEPHVSYRIRIGDDWVSRSSPVSVVTPLISRDSVWTEVAHCDFDGIFWTYSSHAKWVHYSNRYLACNGLFVCGVGNRNNLPALEASHKDGPIDIEHPSLLVEDKNGLLPLKIQRDGLAEQVYPFQQDLVHSIVAELCRELYISLSLALDPSSFAQVLKRVRSCLYKYGRLSGAIVGLSKRGWLPLEPALLRKAEPACLLIDPIQKDRKGLISWLDQSFISEDILLVPQMLNSQGLGVVQAWIRAILLGEEWSVKSPYLFNENSPRGVLFFLKGEVDEFILRPVGGLPRYLRDGLEVVAKKGGWVVYRFGSIENDFISIEDFLACAFKSDARAFCFYFPAALDGSEDLDTPFSKAWLSLVPSGFRES